jgi:hypothetical protein
MTSRWRAVLVAVAIVGVASRVRAGSTEPELAIADVVSSVEGGVVTLQVTGNFDRDDALRLGYPIAVVVAQGNSEARLFLDGRVTVASGGGPATPVPNAPGVVAIAPTRISAVLPPAFGAAGSADVRLEASFGSDALRSNTVGVAW